MTPLEAVADAEVDTVGRELISPIRSSHGFDRRDQSVLDPVVRERLLGADRRHWPSRRTWRDNIIAEALQLWWTHPPGPAQQHPGGDTGPVRGA